MTTYYVHESWKGKRATIHLGVCAHCLRARGAGGMADTATGQWHGPYSHFRDAQDAARLSGQPVSRCKACRPR